MNPEQEPYVPRSLEEKEEAFRLAAELWRAIQQEMQFPSDKRGQGHYHFKMIMISQLEGQSDLGGRGGRYEREGMTAIG